MEYVHLFHATSVDELVLSNNAWNFMFKSFGYYTCDVE